MKDGVVDGVALEDGTEFHAKRVASGADANVTFIKLMDPKDLPAEFLDGRQAHRLQFRDGEDQRRARPSRRTSSACRRTAVGPQHHGTMHICPDQDYIERAYDDAKYGRWSRDPMLECTMATALDDTLAPPGKHILSMFVQYAPTT